MSKSRDAEGLHLFSIGTSGTKSRSNGTLALKGLRKMPAARIHINDETVEVTELMLTGQAIYRDTELPGFALRVGISRRTYFAERKVPGKGMVRRNIGEHGATIKGKRLTAARARQEAGRILEQLKAGLNPVAFQRGQKSDLKRTSLRGRETLGSLFQRYTATTVSSEAARDRLLHRLESAFGSWKERDITALSRPLIRLRHMRLEKECGKDFADETMKLLRDALDFAIRCPQPGTRALKINPVKRKVEQQAWRTGGIPLRKLARWWAAVTDLTSTGAAKDLVVRDYLRFLLLTGARRQEAAQLKWNQVDLQRGLVQLGQIRRAGRWEPRWLPLPDYLVELLANRKNEATSEYVFPSTGERGYVVEPKPQVDAVIQKSGVVFTFESLCKTFRAAARAIERSSPLLDRLINDAERLREPMQKVSDAILSHAGVRKRPASRSMSEWREEKSAARAALPRREEM